MDTLILRWQLPPIPTEQSNPWRSNAREILCFSGLVGFLAASEAVPVNSNARLTTNATTAVLFTFDLSVLAAL